MTVNNKKLKHVFLSHFNVPIVLDFVYIRSFCSLDNANSCSFGCISGEVAVDFKQRGVEVVVRASAAHQADYGPSHDVRVVVVVVPDASHSDSKGREARKHDDDGLVHLAAAVLGKEPELACEVEREEAKAAESTGRVPRGETLTGLHFEVLIVLDSKVVRPVAPCERLEDVYDEKRERCGLEYAENSVVKVMHPIPLVLCNCLVFKKKLN